MTPAQFEQSNILDKAHFINEANSYFNDIFVDIEDIDTKKINKFNADRKKAAANMPKNEFGFRCHFKSAARGDKKLIRSNGLSSVGDDKFYDAISGLMKFPKELGLNSIDFTKGIDSNLKYALNNVLDINFFNVEAKQTYDSLRQKVYQKGSKSNLDAINIKLGTISSENFAHFISYNEIGFAYQELNLEQEKFFICANVKEGYKYMKKIDFKSMTNGDVTVSLYIDSVSHYVYLVFENNNEVVYIVSQRSNLDTANCSFINNSKFTIIENSKKPL